jgi:hypothetical protein
MLSIEQMTVTAYITDGAILCRKCGEKEGLPAKDGLCDYTMQSEFSEDGLYCDTCGKEIVEPYVETCACGSYDKGECGQCDGDDIDEPESEDEDSEEDEDA